jgi:hypothetical protein
MMIALMLLETVLMLAVIAGLLFWPAACAAQVRYRLIPGLW